MLAKGKLLKENPTTAKGPTMRPKAEGKMESQKLNLEGNLEFFNFFKGRSFNRFNVLRCKP